MTYPTGVTTPRSQWQPDVLLLSPFSQTGPDPGAHEMRKEAPEGALQTGDQKQKARVTDEDSSVTLARAVPITDSHSEL
jgi:hypothetical protein